MQTHVHVLNLLTQHQIIPMKHNSLAYIPMRILEEDTNLPPSVIYLPERKVVIQKGSYFLMIIIAYFTPLLVVRDNGTSLKPRILNNLPTELWLRLLGVTVFLKTVRHWCTHTLQLCDERFWFTSRSCHHAQTCSCMCVYYTSTYREKDIWSLKWTQCGNMGGTIPGHGYYLLFHPFHISWWYS